jgi:hypothetical protein
MSHLRGPSFPVPHWPLFTHSRYRMRMEGCHGARLALPNQSPHTITFPSLCSHSTGHWVMGQRAYACKAERCRPQGRRRLNAWQADNVGTKQMRQLHDCHGRPMTVRRLRVQASPRLIVHEVRYGCLNELDITSKHAKSWSRYGIVLGTRISRPTDPRRHLIAICICQCKTVNNVQDRPQVAARPGSWRADYKLIACFVHPSILLPTSLEKE